MPEITRNINSDAVVFVSKDQTIDSDGVVQSSPEKQIQSGGSVEEPLLLLATAQVDKLSESSLISKTDLSNPVPSAPTSLVASDLGKGDAVSLSWNSTANFFNVYIKDGSTLTKVNPTLLENTTTYLAGGLEEDIAVTFVVKAVNGLGQESAESNQAIVTPTFAGDLDRFSNPTWEVKVNSQVVEDAILKDVNLGFGSSFSTANFLIPRDPRLSGLPSKNDEVEIVVNGRLVFKGIITSITKDINSQGLSATYSCTSNILELTKFTLTEIGLDGGNSRFNILVNCPDGSSHLKARANANAIVSSFGVSGAPNVFPGYVDVTDATRLAAAELVLSRIGNFKVYHDMATGKTSAYEFGSGGFEVREFKVGRNIISQSINTSDVDKVKRVEVVGAATTVRRKIRASNFTVARDPNGRLRAKFTLRGKNIRDVQIFGNIRDKPNIEFDDSVQVTLADFQDVNTQTRLKFKTLFEDFENASRSKNMFGGEVRNTQDPDLVLRPAIKEIKFLSTERQPMSAKLVYSGCDTVEVFLEEVPKKWITLTKTGYVKRGTISSDLENPDELTTVTVLVDYDFVVSSVDVEFTVDSNRPFAAAGSGTPAKTITDSQYKITVDTVNHSDNTGSVLTRMATRANSELARLNRSDTGGSITILGDETVDLRSSVRVDGELLEVSGVTHSFTGGFTTTVQLTNEPFFRTIVFPPEIRSANNTRQVEKNNKTFTVNVENRGLAEVVKELQSINDKTDLNPRELGSTAIAL